VGKAHARRLLREGCQQLLALASQVAQHAIDETGGAGRRDLCGGDRGMHGRICRHIFHEEHLVGACQQRGARLAFRRLPDQLLQRPFQRAPPAHRAIDQIHDEAAVRRIGQQAIGEVRGLQPAGENEDRFASGGCAGVHGRKCRWFRPGMRRICGRAPRTAHRRRDLPVPTEFHCVTRRGAAEDGRDDGRRHRSPSGNDRSP